MRRISLVLATVVLGAGLLVGASTLLVEDSPYDDNVDVERTPVAPERPAQLNETSAADYSVAYERTRLWNDLLASRDHSLDASDEVVARCTATSVSAANSGQYRVELDCVGGIDDTHRLFQPGNFSYAVTYHVSGNETVQSDIRGYPFDPGDSLRTPSS